MNYYDRVVFLFRWKLWCHYLASTFFKKKKMSFIERQLKPSPVGMVVDGRGRLTIAILFNGVIKSAVYDLTPNEVLKAK